MRLSMFSLTALITIFASFTSVHPAEHHGIQSPWQPAKGGPVKEDTFIGITKE